MNEHTDSSEGPQEPSIPDPSLVEPSHVDATVDATVDGQYAAIPAGFAPLSEPELMATAQHPLTQPVPHVQPPVEPPYPAQLQPAAYEDPFAPTGQPAPTGTWGVQPYLGSTPGPVWDPTAPPAPGSWGAGMGAGQPPMAWPPSPYGYYPVPPAPPGAPVARKSPKNQIAVIASLVAVLALLLGAGIGHATWPTTTASLAPSSGAPGSNSGSFPFGPGGSGGLGTTPGRSSTGAGAPADTAAIAAKIAPALVDINTNLSYQHQQAAGTGIVLTANGQILTNNHVINGATSISVTDIGNGQSYKANVVGYDRTGDIAVIQLVGASGLQTAPIASRTAVVGQGVVGVGNAGGVGGAPSAAGGSVTALNQAITASESGGGNTENLAGLIETNCAIRPGDSGGALVNAAGQVLGMNTAASSGSSGGGGISQSYAIPIATALAEARSMVAGKGSATIHIGATGFLGIQVQDSSGSQGGSSQGATSGALVDGTLPGSPGALAGLTQGDAITGVDNTPVKSSTDLSSALQAHHPGDVIRLQWIDRNGTPHNSPVTLAIGPPA